MERHYVYHVEGRGKNNTFSSRGQVTHDFGAYNFLLLANKVAGHAFLDVIAGNAEYGHGGPCDGPYVFTKFVVELVEE